MTIDFSVVVPMYNCESYLVDMSRRLFLDGIRRNLPQGSELVLIDDASPLEAETRALADEASAWLPVTYYRNPRNLGFVRSCNEGLRRACGELILSLNSDTRLTPGCMERLAEAVRSAPDIGMSGPMANNALTATVQSVNDFSPLKSFSVEELARVDQFGKTLTRMRAGLVEVNWLMGFCIMLRRELLDSVGLLDERYGLGYHDELDYAIRAREKGWRLVVEPRAFVFHGGLRRNWAVVPNAGTQTMSTRPWRLLFWLLRNTLYSIWKHGWKGYSMPQRIG